jgi:hypothetical protein
MHTHPHTHTHTHPHIHIHMHIHTHTHTHTRNTQETHNTHHALTPCELSSKRSKKHEDATASSSTPPKPSISICSEETNKNTTNTTPRTDGHLSLSEESSALLRSVQAPAPQPSGYNRVLGTSAGDVPDLENKAANFEPMVAMMTGMVPTCFGGLYFRWSRKKNVALFSK